jgi:hypothetical protein
MLPKLGHQAQGKGPDVNTVGKFRAEPPLELMLRARHAASGWDAGPSSTGDDGMHSAGKSSAQASECRHLRLAWPCSCAPRIIHAVMPAFSPEVDSRLPKTPGSR